MAYGATALGVRMIEFELKARVPPERLAQVRAALGPAERVEEHADLYFQHPCRDVAATDEAIRLSRRASRVELTWKGPKLDATTKARREVVVPVADAEAARAFLEALGCSAAMEVRKVRSIHRAAAFEVALDDVPGLGTFVELERILPPDAPRDVPEREARALLATWGITQTERRSYLELLLAQEDARTKPETPR